MSLKKLFMILSVAFIGSCNFFSWAESDGDSYSRCKDEADKGHINKAIEICEAVLASIDDTNDLYAGVNTELGDLYLRKVGMSLPYLADVFLSDACKTNAIDCYLSFAEGLLRRETVSSSNRAVIDKAYYNFNAVKTYYMGLGEVKRVEAIDFFIALTKISKFSFLIAYTDITSLLPNFKITESDICSDDSCNGEDATLPFCFGGENGADENCGGMLKSDGIIIYDSLNDIADALGSAFSDVQDALTSFRTTLIPIPTCVGTAEALACAGDDVSILTNCVYCMKDPKQNVPILGDPCGGLDSGYIKDNCTSLITSVEALIESEPARKADAARKMIQILVNNRSN